MLGIYLIIFVFGAALGSFYYVIGSRPQPDWLNTRSACPHCQQQLKWFQLIPLLSYLWQRGRCGHCQVKISSAYFWIELGSGVLFLLPVLHFGFTLDLLFAWIFTSLLLIITVSDLRHGLIYNGTLLFFLPLLLFNPSASWLGLVFGFFLLYANFLLGKWLFGKETVGGGDIKLYGLVGLMLGIVPTLFSLMLSAILALGWVSLKGSPKNKEMPFGPFIALASYICLFYGQTLWEIWLTLF